MFDTILAHTSSTGFRRHLWLAMTGHSYWFFFFFFFLLSFLVFTRRLGAKSRRAVKKRAFMMAKCSQCRGTHVVCKDWQLVMFRHQGVSITPDPFTRPIVRILKWIQKLSLNRPCSVLVQKKRPLCYGLWLCQKESVLIKLFNEVGFSLTVI